MNGYSRSSQNSFWSVSLFLHLNIDITNLKIDIKQMKLCLGKLVSEEVRSSPILPFVLGIS